MSTDTTTEAGPRLFSAVLADMERGLLDQQMGEALHDLIERVTTLQKSGSVALKIKVAPDEDDDTRLKVVADFDAKPPKPQRRASVFFRDRQGRPTRHYPNQMTDPALGGGQED
ncbi:MAG: hypothetical protein M0P31_15295 [Solirubrobacteraceae bacterium]|nr:hypothetical protein [Solirubrobacteraceae bacterium]